MRGVESRGGAAEGHRAVQAVKPMTATGDGGVGRHAAVPVAGPTGVAADYRVAGSSMAATCSLIAGRSPRRRTSAPASAEPSRLQRPSAKISSGW
jgi:hypothetical protein